MYLDKSHYWPRHLRTFHRRNPLNKIEKNDALPRTACQGFTLVEMAVVLVIIGLVMSLGIGALNAVMGSTASSATKSRQTLIKEALVSFMGSNRRLPCPDVPNNTNGAAGDGSGVTGVEDRTAAGACVANFGVVPYTSLGLSRDIAEDGWGNFMSYQAFFEAAGACPGTKVDWTVTNCFGEGKAGGLWVFGGTLAAPENLAFFDNASLADSRAIAAIISHGSNGLGAWSRQGTQNAAPPAGACEEILNATRAAGGGCAALPTPPNPTIAPLAAPSATTSFFSGERFGNDDVVAFLPAREAIVSAAKQGNVLIPIAKASNDIQFIIDDVKGQATLLTSSNAATFSFTLPSGLITDPWGNNYVISKRLTAVGVDGSVAALGTSAVCVYSLGPDGLLNTDINNCVVNAGSDDVARGLSVNVVRSIILLSRGCAPASC